MPDRNAENERPSCAPQLDGKTVLPVSHGGGCCSQYYRASRGPFPTGAISRSPNPGEKYHPPAILYRTPLENTNSEEWLIECEARNAEPDHQAKIDQAKADGLAIMRGDSS